MRLISPSLAICAIQLKGAIESNMAPKQNRKTSQNKVTNPFSSSVQLCLWRHNLNGLRIVCRLVRQPIVKISFCSTNFIRCLYEDCLTICVSLLNLLEASKLNYAYQTLLRRQEYIYSLSSWTWSEAWTVQELNKSIAGQFLAEAKWQVWSDLVC